MIETVHHPTFSTNDLKAQNKRQGLGAFVRLKNEAEFAHISLNSILPFFDEIVVVFNGCTDETPEIVADFAAKHPDQVRAFHYVPQVHAFTTQAHGREPADSVHSGVFYTNFAMSKVSYDICCKWDGDQVAEPSAFSRIAQKLRTMPRSNSEWFLSPHKLGYWWYVGLNLWDLDGATYVHKRHPFAGRRHDHGFWHMNPVTKFKRHPRFEYLFTRLLRHKYVGCLYFHLKGMKRDRGLGYFDFDNEPRSGYNSFIQRKWLNPPLVTFSEFRDNEPSACSLPDPETLGIRPLATRSHADV